MNPNRLFGLALGLSILGDEPFKRRPPKIDGFTEADTLRWPPLKIYNFPRHFFLKRPLLLIVFRKRTVRYKCLLK